MYFTYILQHSWITKISTLHVGRVEIKARIPKLIGAHSHSNFRKIHYKSNAKRRLTPTHTTPFIRGLPAFYPHAIINTQTREFDKCTSKALLAIQFSCSFSSIQYEHTYPYAKHTSLISSRDCLYMHSINTFDITATWAPQQNYAIIASSFGLHYQLAACKFHRGFRHTMAKFSKKKIHKNPFDQTFSAASGCLFQSRSRQSSLQKHHCDSDNGVLRTSRMRDKRGQKRVACWQIPEPSATEPEN